MRRMCQIVLAVLLGTAFCAELWLRHQSGASLMSRSWGQEDTRIKQNNLTKLAGLDETFPLMATPGGIRRIDMLLVDVNLSIVRGFAESFRQNGRPIQFQYAIL